MGWSARRCLCEVATERISSGVMFQVGCYLVKISGSVEDLQMAWTRDRFIQDFVCNSFNQVSVSGR